MLGMVMIIIVFTVIQKRKSIERQNRHDLELKNKELDVLKAHIETQESEREKIAKNMHDDIGPLVTILKLHLSRFEKMIDRGELTKRHLQEERDFVNVILQNIRSTTQDLSPRFLLRNGLITAFQSFLFELTDLEVDFDSMLEKNVEIPPEIQVNCYRVLLELVNNIVRHDNPSKVWVRIELSEKIIKFTVNHNGRGISNTEFNEFVANSNGLGLSSLKSRITLLNASLDFQILDYPKVVFCVPFENVTGNSAVVT